MAYRTIEPVLFVNNQALVAPFQSNAFALKGFIRCSLTLIFTGTLTGTVTVQASNDFQTPPPYLNPASAVATWVDMPLGLNALSGAGDTYYIDICETGIPFIRVNANITGGAGNLTAVITAKEY